MLKQTNFTREEIVAVLKLNKLKHPLITASCISQDYVDGYNDILTNLIDEFSDPNLEYNTETGFFDCIGPILPE